MIKELKKKYTDDELYIKSRSLIEKHKVGSILNSESQNSDSILNNIPYIMNDKISTKGILTTGYLKMLEDYVPIFDATVFENLKKSGARLLSKSKSDLECINAVSLDICSFGICSDLRNCSVIGFKPTYGLISRYGLFSYASSFDRIAVVAKSVEDIAIVSNEIISYDLKDMTSISMSEELRLDKKIKKIFFIKELVDSNFKKSLDFLEGIEVEEVSIPIELLRTIFPAYSCIYSAELTSSTANLNGIVFGYRSDSDDVIKDSRTYGLDLNLKEDLIKGAYVLDNKNRSSTLDLAQKSRRILVNKLKILFDVYDAMILPNIEDSLLLSDFGGFPSIIINDFNIISNVECDSIVLSIASLIEGDCNV